MRLPTWNGSRSSRWALAVGLAGLLLTSSLAAQDTPVVKGSIKGHLFLENPAWVEAKDPARHGYTFREPVPTVPAQFRRPYPDITQEVTIAALSATDVETPKTPVSVRVGGGRTSPVTIVVPPGTTIEFRNVDPFTHQLYTHGDESLLSVGDTIKGGTRTWKVPTKPGTYELRDRRAPSLRSFVVVHPKVVASVRPRLKGEFDLPVPAEGTYTLQAFFAGRPVGPETPAAVTARGLDLTKTPIEVAKPPTKDEAAPTAAPPEK